MNNIQKIAALFIHGPRRQITGPGPERDCLIEKQQKQIENLTKELEAAHADLRKYRQLQRAADTQYLAADRPDIKLYNTDPD